ncbi:MAG: fumarylacetoacetase [Betaproteobacteria bacterium]
MTMNETHDPRLKSWVDSANHFGTDFPIQNLPHGVFRRLGSPEEFRGGVAIGDAVLDMRAALATGAFSSQAREAAAQASLQNLNGLMKMGPSAWHLLRADLSRVLSAGATEAERLRACLVPQAEAELGVPARIGDYTDFFTSFHHMVNMGRIFQPDNAVLPQFKWMPIAYHGRASSIVASGRAVQRPHGQTRAPGMTEPRFGPSGRLDYEMELGIWIGTGNALGGPIPIDEAESSIFGLCLLNDWSARDIQGWESMPLGPFLAKNFMSSISPWIVTIEALEPFRTAVPRGPDDPRAMENLRLADHAPAGGFDIQLEVWLETAASSGIPMRLSRSSSRHAYWTLAQLVAHHTENGCNLQPGDLLGTGTQSGPTQEEKGCLFELSFGGKEPLRLPNGESRVQLEDGDTVTLRAWSERTGSVRIGFGECRGKIEPARSSGR